MKTSKLIVKDVANLSPNSEIDITDQFMIQDNKIITYSIQSKFVTEETVDKTNERELEKLEEAKRKKEESEEEFREKHQIRSGRHYLHQEHGMIEVSKSEEKFFETNTSDYLKRLFQNFLTFYDL